MINAKTKSTNIRNLSTEEINILSANNNIAEKWESVKVNDDFDPMLVRNCEFYGTITIGQMSRKSVNIDGQNYVCGLYNSQFKSADIGDNCLIRNVYLENYSVGKECVLINVGEIFANNGPSFGNGIDAEGNHLNQIEVSNENGGKKIIPFAKMIPLDAWLQTQKLADSNYHKQLNILIKNNIQLPEKGIVGDFSLIKNIKTINDCYIEQYAHIIDSTTLINSTILSGEKEQTRIGSNVEIKDSIIGYSNHIESGVKAFNIVTGTNVSLEYGLRILNTFVSDNSNIACCEVLSNLLYPFHEQHHNNSFLIASTVQGQANIAAGATIGSNHNSRAADGEIFAERGFWPGLVTNFKHNCKFAPFTLIAKGNYESELNIHLPFSLVSHSVKDDLLQIMPAFWFKYNMYAMQRNNFKFKKKDKRVVKKQHIETEYLAPDTVQAMLNAIIFLRDSLHTHGWKDFQKECPDLFLDGFANKKKAHIIKPVQAIYLYEMMIEYNAAIQIIKKVTNLKDIEIIIENFKKSKHQTNWLNAGGQIISKEHYETLTVNIKTNKITKYSDIYSYFDQLWNEFPKEKLNHALHAWLHVKEKSMEDLNIENILELCRKSKEIASTIKKWSYNSRLKDYENPYRLAVYEDKTEMETVIGRIEDNDFLNTLTESTDSYIKKVDHITNYNA